MCDNRCAVCMHGHCTVHRDMYTSNKRLRQTITPTKAEEPEDELSVEQDALQSIVHNGPVTTRTIDNSGSNGNKEIILRSHTRGHFKRGGPSLRNVLNLMFPKYKTRNLLYGKFTTATIANTTPYAVTETVNTNGHGINCAIGQQQLFSFCHLPLSDRAGFCTNVSTVLGLEYNTTLQNIADNANWTQDSIGQDPIKKIKGSYRSLFFLGGNTKHTFYNTGNVDVNVEFFEIRPKRFLLAAETPFRTVGTDKVINATNVTGTSLYNNSTGLLTALQFTDPNFTFSSHDHLFHDKFVISKPHTVKVVGGETIHYVVNHPPFKYTNSPWWKSMIRAVPEIADATNTNDDIDYAPFCTVWLVVRIKGALVTTDNNNTILSSIAGSSTVGVNTSAVQLAHMQAETFYTRGGLYQMEYQETYNNFQNEAKSATAMFEENPLTDTVVQTQL